MSSADLLITGATGYIGFKILLGALQAGYTVRPAIRSAEKAKSLAYEAIKDVTYVIHLASLLPSPFLDPQTGIYEPTIKSVTTLLASASKEPSVKKIVITSSVFANTPFPPDPSQKITAQTRLPDLSGLFDSMLPAYRAGKIAGLNFIEKFIKEKEPFFIVINVFPGFVFGRDDRAVEVLDLYAGTNRILLAVITGQSAPNPMPAGVTHVDDAWKAVEKHFPEAVADSTFTQGNQPTVPISWNSHQTEIDLKFNFKTYEDMVVDVAGQYLELSGKNET